MSDLISSARAVSRRRFLYLSSGLLGSAALSACTTSGPVRVIEAAAARPAEVYTGFGDPALMYGPMVDDGFAIPAVPFDQIDPQFYRQVVPDPTGEAPGTVVVDTSQHFLYFTRPGGQAIRYGVGLGRAGFEWSGAGVIQWKQRWPKWTPPAEMIARDPSLAKWGVEFGGMPGGLDNPLGARALYIFQNGEDTLYRVHGSPEWQSIGRSVSSGCVRMMNQDVIDLYDRVPNGTPIKVVGGGIAQV